jgi:hypothetical protein
MSARVKQIAFDRAHHAVEGEVVLVGPERIAQLVSQRIKPTEGVAYDKGQQRRPPCERRGKGEGKEQTKDVSCSVQQQGPPARHTRLRWSYIVPCCALAL